MFDIVSVICIAAIAGAIGYFIGWMNGVNDGREEERQYNLSLRTQNEQTN